MLNSTGRARGPRRALVFGEAVIDHYPDGSLVGGAPLHVATHLAASGWLVQFVTRVGRDAAGRRIKETLETYGVSTTDVEVDPRLPTGAVSVQPGSGFHIHSPAAYDSIEGPGRIPGHSLFCYGSLAARNPLTRTALERLLRVSGGLRAMDANLRSPYVFRQSLSALLTRAQLLKATEDELDRITSSLGLRSGVESLFSAAAGLTWVCITRGREGAELVGRTGERWSQPGPRVGAVDEVGAGDAFFARLAGALAAGFSEEAALTAATAAAGSVLVRRGGLPRLPV